MKEIKKSLSSLILFIILCPIIINLTMFLPFSLTIEQLSPKEWLGFYGSYIGGAIGGIGTIIAVFYTMKYYEKQNQNNLKSLKNAFVLNKIDEIIKKIIDREAVPKVLYAYDSELASVKEKIDKYNEIIPELSAYFIDKAIEILISLFFINGEDGEGLPNNLSNYLRLPVEIREYAVIIGKLALHENCPQLIKSHPQIGHIIEKEAGGSYGLWHHFLQKIDNEDERSDDLKKLFEIVPTLLNDIFQIKIGLQ